MARHATTTHFKKINSHSDLVLWKRSKAFHEILEFIKDLNNSVMSKDNNITTKPSKNINMILSLFDKLDALLEEHPPEDMPQRYGNVSYRSWFNAMEYNSKGMIEELLTDSLHQYSADLMPYFLSSFGNPTRLDYGTGHELSFIVWLCCLSKLGFLTRDDHSNIVVRVFIRLEPAGSKGAWGADDYQFLPYFWGSSQLIGTNILPTAATSKVALATYSSNYLYFYSMNRAYKSKKQTANELKGLERLIYGTSWKEINEDLLNTYIKDVIGSFQVVQNFLFGNVFSFSARETLH